jgi:cytochrome oxidase Cu insertion factor (SCO1/SenC/PrrC family)
MNARTKRRLRVAAFAVLGVVVVLGALVVFTVYKPIARRAGSAVASSTAPDFSLPDQSGKTTTLVALTERGPAVIVFYRGFW